MFNMNFTKNKYDIHICLIYLRCNNNSYLRSKEHETNIKVSIYKENKLVEEIVTDNKGEYKALLLNGNYIIHFEQPNGLIETFEGVGSEQIDSDIIEGNVIVTVSDENQQDISAGYTKPVGKMKKK